MFAVICVLNMLVCSGSCVGDHMHPLFVSFIYIFLILPGKLKNFAQLIGVNYEHHAHK